MTDEKGQILRLLRDQEAAIRRGDVEMAISILAEDVVTYDLPPPLEYRGSSAPVADALRDWFATWKDGVTVEMKDPQLIVEGDLAVAFGLTRMRGTKKDVGPLDQWHRRTVVLRRRNGEWGIVHEHSSFPMRMDGSGTSATDLKP